MEPAQPQSLLCPLAAATSEEQKPWEESSQPLSMGCPGNPKSLQDPEQNQFDSAKSPGYSLIATTVNSVHGASPKLHSPRKHPITF